MDATVEELYPLKSFTLSSKGENDVPHLFEGIIAHNIDEAKKVIIQLFRAGKITIPPTMDPNKFVQSVMDAEHEFHPLTNMDLYPIVENDLKNLHDEGEAKVKTLSDADKKVYLESGGQECPLCGSGNVEGGLVDIKGNHAYQDISCLDCEKEWTDEYTLSGIKVID